MHISKLVVSWVRCLLRENVKHGVEASLAFTGGNRILVSLIIAYRRSSKGLDS